MRYKIGEFAAKLNVHTDTLRRWDSNGKLVAQRSVGGTRYYTDEHFQKALRLELEQKPKKSVIYFRVSSPNQMVEDLMAIIHTFSCRLYGLRKYKKAKDVLGDEAGAQDKAIPE